jgi:hypothetical protein
MKTHATPRVCCKLRIRAASAFELLTSTGTSVVSPSQVNGIVAKCYDASSMVDNKAGRYSVATA